MTGHYVSCAHILPPTGGGEISIRHDINQTSNRLERTAAEAGPPPAGRAGRCGVDPP
jgi:hypothetical protein